MLDLVKIIAVLGAELARAIEENQELSEAQEELQEEQGRWLRNAQYCGNPESIDPVTVRASMRSEWNRLTNALGQWERAAVDPDGTRATPQQVEAELAEPF